MGQYETQSTLLIQQAQTLLDEYDVYIVITRARRNILTLVELDLKRSPLLQGLYSNIGRVSDDCIESAGLYDFRKRGFPVEGIDSIFFFVAEKRSLIENIRPDE